MQSSTNSTKGRKSSRLNIPLGDSLFVVTRPDRLIEARIMRNG